MKRRPGSGLLTKLVWVAWAVFLILPENARAGEVAHYLEGNLLLNIYTVSGPRIGDAEPLSAGFNIAHGSNITPVHSLVISYGQDLISGARGTPDGAVTTIAFYLRRYIPGISTEQWQPFATIGSGYYRYEQDGVAGSLENAGVILGLGTDYVLNKNWRFVLEMDYRGFSAKRFGNDAKDRIQSVTLQFGLKYFYSTSKW